MTSFRPAPALNVLPALARESSPRGHVFHDQPARVGGPAHLVRHLEIRTIPLFARSQRVLGLFLLGDVLRGSKTAYHLALAIKLQAGALAHPLDSSVDDDAVFDVVRFTAQARQPFLVHGGSVVRMNGVEEGLIGQRRAPGHAKDPPVLVGPD